MVVAGTVFYLFVVGVYVLSDGLWRSEIERRTFYETYFSCGNAHLVDRNIKVCIDFAL